MKNLVTSQFQII